MSKTIIVAIVTSIITSLGVIFISHSMCGHGDGHCKKDKAACHAKHGYHHADGASGATCHAYGDKKCCKGEAHAHGDKKCCKDAHAECDKEKTCCHGEKDACCKDGKCTEEKECCKEGHAKCDKDGKKCCSKDKKACAANEGHKCESKDGVAKACCKDCCHGDEACTAGKDKCCGSAKCGKNA